MITTLSIKNYALIEDIRVDFESGLTIITGETGAGKSILLGALGLVLGNRADLKVMRNTAEKCIIEAEFDLSRYDLEPFFVKQELDFDLHTILRREILPSGKSRAFVNDTPVRLQELQLLGSRLIDIHSQNDTRELTSESYQLQVLDALASNQEALAKYQLAFKEFKTLSERLENLITTKEQAAKDLDYHQFLLQELQEAQLGKMDQEAMEEAHEKLSNAEAIQEALSNAVQYLGEEQIGSLSTLVQARGTMQGIRGFSSEYENLWARLNSCIIELEDLASEIEQATESLDADPMQQQLLEEQLQQLYRLQKKHTVDTVDALLQIEVELMEKVEAKTSVEEAISQTEYLREKQILELQQIAEELDANRQQAIPNLKEKLESMLAALGMPNARFELKILPLENFRKNGKSQLEMLFTANKGLAVAPLSKVASGGEMSRIMLSVKAAMAPYSKLATLIFDEIDTGVSGEIAQKLAGIIGEMSERVQIISITHLAQIAAKGNYHKKVYKTVEDGRTKTKIRALSKEERILEIAEMIGGRSLSDSAIAHAKQLLN